MANIKVETVAVPRVPSNTFKPEAKAIMNVIISSDVEVPRPSVEVLFDGRILHASPHAPDGNEFFGNPMYGIVDQGNAFRMSFDSPPIGPKFSLVFTIYSVNEVKVKDVNVRAR